MLTLHWLLHHCQSHDPKCYASSLRRSVEFYPPSYSITCRLQCHQCHTQLKQPSLHVLDCVHTYVFASFPLTAAVAVAVAVAVFKIQNLACYYLLLLHPRLKILHAIRLLHPNGCLKIPLLPPWLCLLLAMNSCCRCCCCCRSSLSLLQMSSW